MDIRIASTVLRLRFHCAFFWSGFTTGFAPQAMAAVDPVLPKLSAGDGGTVLGHGALDASVRIVQAGAY
ncbi:hypothetical protein [Jidongwangia harbinensis]|uniref:hypothetical protein n=1 Tax=Jidongwangia harbinensis TaxID=2878561 RepID=UPI001CD99899|nr:hypothetical protein [Jidongwangia harbinensis]MCA2216282.1 hypothetical protein [Jidongwangia harbinensis]MCA2217017.1 hypothetical protein [Jidongwangia harbinensis]